MYTIIELGTWYEILCLDYICCIHIIQMTICISLVMICMRRFGMFSCNVTCMLHRKLHVFNMHDYNINFTFILVHARASSSIHKTSYRAIATYGYMYMYMNLYKNYAHACIAVLPLSRQQHDMIRKCALIYAFCIPTHTHTHTTPPHAHAVKWPHYHSNYNL